MSAATQLAELLGPGAVSTSEEDLLQHATDWSPSALLARRSHRPLPVPECVVRPRSTEEVATVLRWADETRTPVVPFGGGSGVVSAIAPEGAVVVDCARLNQISEIDETSGLVTVGAGVTGAALTAALDERGYLLGHEPQSIAISTVGGWIATRACGQLSARFGGIEDLIAGSEAVLPGGRIVRARALPRRACGPDVAALLVGSEGTLGVITEATLRIRVKDVARSDVCVLFEHMADGVRACRLLVQSDLRPTLVRLYDREDAALLLRHRDDGGKRDPGALLLLSFDGEAHAERANRAAELSGGTPGDRSLVAYWWSHRNDAVEEFRRIMTGDGILGPHGVVETIEVAATWMRLRSVYHEMKSALTQAADLAACHLSHVYPDGACLYFTLASVCSDDDDAADRLRLWWETAMAACLGAGGTISHHHGIGRTRAPWLREELGGWFDVLRTVKHALDPHGIMNPGALGL